MVMWFNVKEAREQLLNKGVVFTLRPKKRREGHEILMYEGFGKKGDLNVEFLMEGPKPFALEYYLHLSGFKSVTDWLKAAENSKFLYRVKLLGLVDKPKGVA